MAAPAARRRLRRVERAAIYSICGVAMEVVFTSIDRARRPATRSAHLSGHSYLWMLPIYASIAWLFEPVHDATRNQPAWRRAGTYAAGIIGVEYATGVTIKRVAGVVPWDYTGQSRMVLHGATRFDYFPLWAVAGLGMERIHDTLRRVSVETN